MADIKPFVCVRPAEDVVSAVAALPYDVYNREEAKEVVAKNPKSFLAIDRAETQFPDDVDTYDDRVYAKAAQMLKDWIADGTFIRDNRECYYIYELTMDGRTQTGIAACASIDDYANQVIKKHENTRAEKYKEKPDICNAIGAHHDETEMTSLLAPIVQVCDAISGARPGARREIVEAYIKRLNDLEQLAMSYPGVTKTYAIQAGRELRVIVGADKIDDTQTENLSGEIAKKIQDEMTYPGQVKITVIRETRAVSFAK